MKDGLYWVRDLIDDQVEPFVAMFKGAGYFRHGFPKWNEVYDGDIGRYIEILGPATPPGKLFMLKYHDEGENFGGVFSTRELAERNGDLYDCSSIHEIKVDECVQAEGEQTYAVFSRQAAYRVHPDAIVNEPEGDGMKYIKATSPEEAVSKYKASQEQVVS
jgi:hypothetical protein